MIIRMNPYKTLKASTLNNREVRSTPGEEMCTESTLKESPSCAQLGHSFRGLAPTRSAQRDACVEKRSKNLPPMGRL